MKKVKPVEKTKVSILTLLEEKVNVGRLISRIELKEDKLIDAALEQPSLIKSSGQLRVQAFHKRTMLETKLRLAEAKAGLRLRRIRDNGGKKEFTEGAVKERIQLQPKVRLYRHRLDRALAEEELAKMLSDVFRKRSDAIREIVNAGKVSVHAKELELLKSSKRLNRAVIRIRDRWQHSDEESNL